MKTLKIGMIGLDTSHCVAFTELLNNENNEYHVEGGRVTVAYPGGSKLFSKSRERVDQFTNKLKDDHGVGIVDSVQEAAEDVDAVLLESVDGRQHLEQFEKIAHLGKPVFIDKPFTTSSKDAEKIIEMAQKYKTPVFSCSPIRYAAGIKEPGDGKQNAGCMTFGPTAILEDYPGYFWYGIHCADVLFSKMGTGCVEVNVVESETADIISGRWEDGRVGAIYGYRIEGVGVFGCNVFDDNGVQSGNAASKPPFYALLLPEIIRFFNSGKSPVQPEEMIEITAFLEAANESREKGGKVKL